MKRFYLALTLALLFVLPIFTQEFTQHWIRINQNAGSSSLKIIKIKNNTDDIIRNINLSSDDVENIDVVFDPLVIEDIYPEKVISVSMNITSSVKPIFIRKVISFNVYITTSDNKAIDQLDVTLRISPPNIVWIIISIVIAAILFVIFTIIFIKMNKE